MTLSEANDLWNTLVGRFNDAFPNGQLAPHNIKEITASQPSKS